MPLQTKNWFRCEFTCKIEMWHGHALRRNWAHARSMAAILKLYLISRNAEVSSYRAILDTDSSPEGNERIR